MLSTWAIDARLNHPYHRRYRGFEGLGRAAEPEPAAFRPAVDVVEDEEAFWIRAELPGMAREDLDVQVEKNELTLNGEKCPDQRLPAGASLRSERSYGRFTRSFVIPRTIDTQKIEASFQGGILEVKLPKRPAPVPSKVELA